MDEVCVMKRWMLLLIVLLLLCCAAAGEGAYQPLQYGDKNEAVLQLQTRLKELLYYNGPLSGEYGDLTRSAVKRVQAAYGLEQTGKADPAVQEIIFGECYRELKYEMSGADVSTLQDALRIYGYYHDKTSGNYLKNTRAAVKAFQQDNGLEATGVADVRTQALLYSGTVPIPTATPVPTPTPTPVPTPTPAPTPTPDLTYQGKLKTGSTGARVRLLQERLDALGFFEGSITNGFYARTNAAVKAFQKHNGLKVDGVVGKETWEALFGDAAVPASATAVPPKPSPYFIEVDVANQVTKVYTRDDNGDFTVLYRTFICSTGTKGFPSTLGTFTLTERRALWAQFPKWGGGTAQYWTQINESIAFHSVMYEDYDPMKLKTGSFRALGTRASHGCIRLTVPDAKWIYNNCIAGTQVWIHDDAPSDPELVAAIKPGSINPNTKINFITPTPTIPPTYDSKNPPETVRKLKEGSKGEEVYWLQMRLKELGFYEGTCTGTYLGGTTRAVKAYQKSVGISADGVAGVQTLNRLYEDARATPTPAPTEVPTPTPAPTEVPTETPAVTETPAPVDGQTSAETEDPNNE